MYGIYAVVFYFSDVLGTKPLHFQWVNCRKKCRDQQVPLPQTNANNPCFQERHVPPLRRATLILYQRKAKSVEKFIEI